MNVTPNMQITDYGKRVAVFSKLSKLDKINQLSELAEIDRRELGNRTSSQLTNLFSRLIANEYSDDGRKLT